MDNNSFVGDNTITNDTTASAATNNTLFVVTASLVLGILTVLTIVGNVFVIAAIVRERDLRKSSANYLVLSLAVADLMVAMLVMPLGNHPSFLLLLLILIHLI